MNVRYWSFVVGVCALTLAACGGGAGGGSIPAAPASNPTSNPTATPQYSPRPAGAGDRFSFSGTLSRSDSYTYPSPSPLPSTSTTAAVTQNVTVLATSNPFGPGSVQDFQTAETDAYPQQTRSSTSEVYVQSGAAFLLLGTKSTDSNSNSSKTVYASAQTLDQLPEVAGAAWSNSPAATITQQFGGNENATRVIANDGSYTDVESIYAPNPGATDYPSTQAIITENADGSGELSEIRHENGRPPPYQPNEDVYYNYFISAPTAQSANSQVLTVSYQFEDLFPGSPGPSPTPAPIQAIVAFPVWYNSPVSLYAETDKDLGPQPIPAACGLSKSAGAQGMQIEQKISSLDTVLGTSTTTTTDQYVVAGFGPVCVQIASTIEAYYDYNQDTLISNGSPIFYQGSAPLQTTQFAQTLTLAQQSPYPQSKRPAAAGGPSTSGAVPLSAIEIANARANIAHLLELDRAKRVRALANHLVRYFVNQGVRS